MQSITLEKLDFTKLDDLEIAITMSLLIAAYVFTASSLTGDYSYIDRLWSILPVIYSWGFTLSVGFKYGNYSVRGLLISLLITAWGIRLTYNFYRKGGYSGMEDYRWAILRDKIKSKIAWTLFSFLFIAVFQSFLLLAITFPVYKVGQDFIDGQTDITFKDVICSIIFALLLLGETVADNQQFAFQTKKYKLINQKKKLPKKYARGFITSGLFKYSRHPNFFCEISIWWTVCLFGLDKFTDLGWTMAGAGLLNLLFLGSTQFTEDISSSKYKEYSVIFHF
jgi:steroid 5-alpha reductase family enzyme